MDLKETLISSDFILAEAAIIETLRRDKAISLHPHLENALLIYDPKGKAGFARIYGSFIELAQTANVPLLLCAPTWRANPQRLQSAGVESDLIQDAADFLLGLRNQYPGFAHKVFVGGLIGPKNDAYRPEEALNEREAESFHTWQIKKIARSGLDFLQAATLPSLSEATGIALALQQVDIPYIISFVINSSALVLDGTPLEMAFRHIDEVTRGHPPLGYMINCAYPSFLKPEEQREYVFERLLGFQGNASSLDHAELDGSYSLQMDDKADWGEIMVQLNRKYGIKILGGCCGTTVQHLEYLVDSIQGL